LHRDLKPSNILVDGHGHGFLVDFGLVHTTGSGGVTVAGRMIGTPAYMAPEQIRADHDAMGPPLDIWGFGVVLYELATGRLPFDATVPYEIFDQVLGKRSPAPSALVNGLPVDFDRLIRRCLDREPARRYVDGAALAADLRRLRDGKPLEGSGTVGWNLCIGRPTPRQGLVMAAGGAVILLIWLFTYRFPAIALAASLAVGLAVWVRLLWQRVRALRSELAGLRLENAEQRDRAKRAARRD
jgi:hypothetical protein